MAGNMKREALAAIIKAALDKLPPETAHRRSRWTPRCCRDMPAPTATPQRCCRHGQRAERRADAAGAGPAAGPADAQRGERLPRHRGECHADVQRARRPGRIDRPRAGSGQADARACDRERAGRPTCGSRDCAGRHHSATGRADRATHRSAQLAVVPRRRRGGQRRRAARGRRMGCRDRQEHQVEDADSRYRDLEPDRLGQPRSSPPPRSARPATTRSGPASTATSSPSTTCRRTSGRSTASTRRPERSCGSGRAFTARRERSATPRAARPVRRR